MKPTTKTDASNRAERLVSRSLYSERLNKSNEDGYQTGCRLDLRSPLAKKRLYWYSLVIFSRDPVV